MVVKKKTKKLSPPMRLRSYHVFFGISLMALIALGVWWFILVWEQVERVHAAGAEIMNLECDLIARELGLMEKVGESLPRSPDENYEVIPTDSLTAGSTAYALNPNRPELSIRVKPEKLRQMEEKLRRRQVMVMGEGALLLFLLGVCVIMLYILLISERRGRLDMETFFQAVSHELKTPLSGVKALIQTLSSRELAFSEIERLAKLGLKETTRLESLVDNVLLANRIDRNIFKPNPRDILIVPETREFIERRNRIFPKSRADVVVECDEGLRAVTDPDLMGHVMENLCGNAFRYSGEKAEVKVYLRESADWCNIVVKDKGRGLKPDERERIFEKFYRGSNEADSRKKGSGLGLFIVYELVKSFGGEIEVESDGPGKGSSFTVRLRKA